MYLLLCTGSHMFGIRLIYGIRLEVALCIYLVPRFCPPPHHLHRVYTASFAVPLTTFHRICDYSELVCGEALKYKYKKQFLSFLFFWNVLECFEITGLKKMLLSRYETYLYLHNAKSSLVSTRALSTLPCWKKKVKIATTTENCCNLQLQHSLIIQKCWEETPY